jgi:hypothetical protein
VTTKEFAKFDIDVDKIASGEDTRTTVMVRNLIGASARKDFMLFLDKSGLSENYMFFYMPCKEHRNIPAGFAFVNFRTSQDVLNLFLKLQEGLWKECASNPQAKPPAVSYARFQGQEELMKHFSTSAVLHESDPEKRPVFRTKAGHLQEMRSPQEGSTDSPTISPKQTKSEKKAAQQAANQLQLQLQQQLQMQMMFQASDPMDSWMASGAAGLQTGFGLESAARDSHTPSYIKLPSSASPLSMHKRPQNGEPQRVGPMRLPMGEGSGKEKMYYNSDTQMLMGA